MTPDRKTAEIKAWVRGQVGPTRYRHIRGVVGTAVRLAPRYGLSPGDAALAAWLHDCAKELPRVELKRWIRKGRLKLDRGEWAMPALWHPHAGAAIAALKWGIRKPAILEAIRCHTLGGPGMGPLAQLIYIADFIEPGRTFPGITEVRKMSKAGLREAVLAKTSKTMEFLVQKRAHIHPRLVETWNYYLNQ